MIEHLREGEGVERDELSDTLVGSLSLEGDEGK
jgi:hypothetical protein